MNALHTRPNSMTNAANAKYIVTEDHHFNVLKTVVFPVVNVINIDEFLWEIENI